MNCVRNSGMTRSLFMVYAGIDILQCSGQASRDKLCDRFQV